MAWLVDPGSPVTARRLECLSLVAHGLTSQQIARKLEIGATVVDEHVERAMFQLGASTRAHAVALAIGRKLIEPPQ